MYMKITRWDSRNMSSKLFMKYGRDFALTEKTRFVVLYVDSAPSFMHKMKQKTADFYV